MNLKLEYFDDKIKTKHIPGFKKPYNIKPCCEYGFHQAKEKILVIIQHVSSGDLNPADGERRLLGDDATHTTYTNILTYAKKYAEWFNKKPVKDVKFAFVNFNNFRSYDLPPSLRSVADDIFKKRIFKYIKLIEPDKIFIIGDIAAEKLLADTKYDKAYAPVHKYRMYEHKLLGIPTWFTISIDKAFTALPGKDDLDEKAILGANLLGYAGRCLANAWIDKKLNKHLRIGNIKIDYKVISSLKKFDAFYKELMKAKAIAFDIESTNLSALSNKLLLLQFCLDGKLAYEIPMYHKDSPFSNKDMEYIRKKLGKWLGQKMDYYEGMKKTRYLIGVNIGFDIKVMRHWCNVPYTYWPMWDVQAGAFLIDENMKGIQDYNYKSRNVHTSGYYNLANLACEYGCDYYYGATFGKEQRTIIKDVPLKEVYEYGGADVIIPFKIHEIQKYITQHMPVGDKSYWPYFHRMILVQQCQIVRVQSVMKHRGHYVDEDYLLEVSKPDGPVEKRIAEVTSEFNADKYVRKANKKLIAHKNIPTMGLFGAVTHNIFDISKREHKKILFEKVMKLEPIATSKKTGDAKYDKYFLKEYKDDYPCLDLLLRISSIQKIRDSFITPFVYKLANDLDSSIDKRIRPDYGYLPVVTGRSNSFDPSLQQIPEHSEDAKVPKAMFAVEKGKLHYEADYAAHEVRNWGVLSNDSAIASSFKKIHNYLVDFRLKPTVKKMENLKSMADPHRQNYELFTGTPALEVTDDQRFGAKGITFGSMYGKGVPSLSRDIKKSLKETKKIMDRFFSKFHKAKKWLDNKVKMAHDHYYTISPLGRRRNLFCMMSGNRVIVAAGERRAQNSEIQGFSSDIGFAAADLFSRALSECLTKLNEKMELPPGPNVMIHDSVKGEAEFHLYILHLHLLEWAMTNGVAEFIQKVYDFKPNVCYEIEFDVSGINWSTKRTWKGPRKMASYEDMKENDGKANSLEFCVKKALIDHNSKYNNIKNIDKLYKKMLKSYEQQKIELDLDKIYPLNNKKQKIS